ncbi:MAG: methyltransferase family protein [Promethearchaeota archaeon]
MSSHEHSHGIGKEHPRSHEIQLFCLIFFFIVWVFDSIVLNLTKQLSNEIPLIIRLPVFLILGLIAFRLVNGSHKLVLGKVELNVVEEDVYAILRHPMYSAYFIVFLAFIQLTMSLISLVPFAIAVFLLNMIAAHEEKELISILGQEYIDYMKRVPRWIPNPVKFLKTR